LAAFIGEREAAREALVALCCRSTGGFFNNGEAVRKDIRGAKKPAREALVKNNMQRLHEKH
jgi:hypothetical protein